MLVSRGASGRAALAAIGATMIGAVVVAAAERVPVFNVEPSCRAAASRAGSPDYASICLREEQQARDEIARLWPQFPAGDKARCVPLSTLGGTPTYTELLTCLEMVRDARRIRDSNEPATTGRGSR